jgi:hypothetical protein
MALDGSGVEGDPWLIQSLEDFNDFAADANYWDDYTRLETDVNLAGRTYSTAVIAPDVNNSNTWFDDTAFTGVFDGDDHKITNLSIDDAGAYKDYLGLFGCIGEGGEVRNLGLEGVSIVGTGSFVGSMVGENLGIVSNCYSTGNVSGSSIVGGLVGQNGVVLPPPTFSIKAGYIYNSCSTGSVQGNSCVGGLVGGNSGFVSDCNSTSSVNGFDSVGGLAGGNWYGSVSHCYSTGDVSGVYCVGGLVGFSGENSNVSKCYSTGETSGDHVVGGLIGRNVGIVSNCYSTGDVSGFYCVGGLVGDNFNYVYISNCYSTGDVNGLEVVGGLVGANHGTVLNCYSIGDVNGLEVVGGLMGYNFDSVSNCFWDTDTQTHGVTESIGLNEEGTITNVSGLPTAQMQTENTFTDFGWDFIDEYANGTSETWQMPAGGGYPILSFFHIDIPYPLAGSGTEEKPYLVSDANELGMLSWYTDGCHIKMTRDIDLSGINWSVPVVLAFSGYFDGNNCIINSMQISGSGYLGLFGFLRDQGQIRNLGLVGGSIRGTGNFIGGLVGYKQKGFVSHCYSISDISGLKYVGGLVGENWNGNVSNCYSTGDVNGVSNVGGLVGENWKGNVSNCYSTGDVNGVSNVGGLVGYNYFGGVSNCYSTGDVNGGEHVGGLAGYNLYGNVLNCYSTGDVSGDDDVGGLVGYDYYGSVSNCFWDTDNQTHGVTESIGLNEEGTITNVSGLTTAEMQTKNTFTDAGWDFITPIWKMNCEGMSYPKLSLWQPVPGDFLCPDGVNFFDYSFFAAHWAEDNCGASNDCDGRDLDLLGSVDIKDLRIFADNWLAGF